MMSDDQPNPFPILIDVATLPKSGFPVSDQADDAQRAAIAGRFGLLDVEAFTVKGRMFRWRSKGARFEGDMVAKVTAACVVTGTPVAQTIRDDLNLTFVPDGSRLARPASDADGELVLDLDAEDPPEVFVGTSIDVGSVVLELFSLELDPFPRAPDAPEHLEFTTASEEEAAADEKPSPFAALAALKDQAPGNDNG